MSCFLGSACERPLDAKTSAPIKAVMTIMRDVFMLLRLEAIRACGSQQSSASALAFEQTAALAF
jgi:hypothetical protein